VDSERAESFAFAATVASAVSVLAFRVVVSVREGVKRSSLTHPGTQAVRGREHRPSTAGLRRRL
jgi:hypothetical protein